MSVPMYSRKFLCNSSIAMSDLFFWTAALAGGTVVGVDSRASRLTSNQVHCSKLKVD